MAPATAAENERSLLSRIDQVDDPVGVCMAASELLFRLHRAPAAVPDYAAEVLLGSLVAFGGAGAVEGAPTWRPPVQGQPLHANRALRGGAALAAAFQPLADGSLEAASAIMAVLLDLLTARESDRLLLRQHLLETGSDVPGCFWLFLRVLATSDAPHGTAAFIRCCHIIAVMAQGDEVLSRALRAARVLDLAADQLARVTKGDEVGIEWLPFATAAAHLLDVLVCECDSECNRIEDPKLFVPAWAHARKPGATVDALVAALRRSLRDGGHMVAQPLHVSCLRTLGVAARLSRGQAQRMLGLGAADLAVAVLRHPGSDEEPLHIALWLLAELAHGSPFSAKTLAAAGAEAAAERAMARYPRSQKVRVETERVIKACKG